MFTLSSEDLARLRCPVTGSTLQLADDAMLDRVNAGITAQAVLSRISDPVSEPLEAGLLNADHTLLYRISEGIITLLASEAIEVWEYGEQD